MIKSQLNKLRFYILEKERLENDLKHLDDLVDYGYRSPTFENLSNTKPVASDEKMIKIIERNNKVIALIEKRKAKLEVTIIKLLKIINNINDPIIRNIVELRCLKGWTYEEIGNKIGYSKAQTYKIFNNFINS